MLEDQVPKTLAELPCPDYPVLPMVAGKPLSQRRVAMISTAGLLHRGDRAYSPGASDYRVLDSDSGEPILMGHLSTNFDRSGFAQDLNVVFPIDHVRTLAQNGEIGSVARYHYSFMGATEPQKMEAAALQLARTLAQDEVDLAILIPV